MGAAIQMDPVQSGPASTKSDFNVEVVRVKNVRPHPNADRLDLCEANGYPVVIRKGDFQEGNAAIYVPVDALVPIANPAFAFLADSKGRSMARIRAARLRGVYSEGLLIPMGSLAGKLTDMPRLGQNVQAELGIEKWLSPADREELAQGIAPSANSKRSLAAKANRLMPVYGLDSIIRFPEMLPIGTRVIITEKIHGANARYSYQQGRFWIGSHRTLRSVTGHRLITALRAAWHFLVGLCWPRKAKGYYADTLGDVWVQIAKKEGLAAKCKQYAPNLVIYGEVYGKGLQTRGGVEFVYDAPTAQAFRVFDIYDPATASFLSYDEMFALCAKMGLATVPLLLPVVTWDGNAKMEFITKGTSMLASHMREGVVVRTDVTLRDPKRVALKFVSTDYKMLGDKE